MNKTILKANNLTSSRARNRTRKRSKIKKMKKRKKKKNHKNDLPIYESSFSSLYFPKNGVIGIVPLCYIKSLLWNIRCTIFPINENFPEIVKSLTCKDAIYKYLCTILRGESVWNTLALTSWEATPNANYSNIFIHAVCIINNSLADKKVLAPQYIQLCNHCSW